MIKVLVVDDSSFMRKVISDMLNSDKEIQVIDTAKNGLEALSKIQKLKPDVVTLDIRMPDISGLDVLDETMEKFPVPIIILSAYTKERAEESIQAFEYGAVEVIAKPSGEISLDLSIIKDKLIQAVKTASKVDIKKLLLKRIKKLISIPEETHKELLIIGASTGGPFAITQIISNLPKDFPIPIIIIQHMPGKFTKILAERLDKKSEIKVIEAKQSDILRPGIVFVAPGDFNLRINKNFTINLIRAKNKKASPSIDLAFMSAAKIYKEKVIAVVLTGMGEDGSRGVRELKKEKSIIIAQDKKTSVVFGMPKSVIENKDADFVLPLNKISEKIGKLLYKKTI